MFPRALIEKSIAEKIDVIRRLRPQLIGKRGACAPIVEGKPITVLPGMEISTLEEVHLLPCLTTWKVFTVFRAWFTDHLPGVNQEEIFGVRPL